MGTVALFPIPNTKKTKGERAMCVGRGGWEDLALVNAYYIVGFGKTKHPRCAKRKTTYKN